MASTDKTGILGLSKWRSTDKPKRIDFVGDNEIIDSTLGGHINNADLHLSTENKLKLDEPFLIKTVVGTGDAYRSIPISFEPRAIIAFAADKPPAVTIDGSTKAYAAFAIQGKFSTGIDVLGKDLRLYQSSAAVNGVIGAMNEKGVTYVILLFR